MKQKKEFPLLVVLFLFAMLVTACDTLLSGFQQVDTQSATLTAMVSPTFIIPTLDLKGSNVMESEACEPYEVVCISIFEDRMHGSVMEWAKDTPIFAYVAPENRYWAWFSGDAVTLDFSEDAAFDQHNFEKDKQLIAPIEYSTSDLHVFGDFAFSPDHSKLAFVTLRESEKIYSIEVADYSNELKTSRDIFPGTLAETDTFASDKSVIEWTDNSHVRVASSCGVDCERIFLADVTNGDLVLEDEVRKNGHNGRVQDPNVHEYDDREYPAMSYMDWSPDGKFLFYSDARRQSWIRKEGLSTQFELPINGGKMLQTLWSADSQYLAVRYEDKIQIYRVNCGIQQANENIPEQ